MRAALDAAGLISDTSRFVYVGLEEPARAVSEHPAEESEPTDRRFRVLLHDLAGAAHRDIVMSTTRGVVDTVVELDAVGRRAAARPGR